MSETDIASNYESLQDHEQRIEKLEKQIDDLTFEIDRIKFRAKIDKVK